MTDVLVLNKSFYAIQVAPWPKALSLLWQGHAEAVDDNYQTYNFQDWADLSQVIEDHPEGYVCTPTLKLAIPTAIRLTRFEKLPEGDVKFTRRNIYDHYKYTCSYCGEKKGSKELNLDHVMPASRGGKTSWDNIVLSCIPCNLKKADRTPKEARMALRVKPSRPRWRGHQSAFLRSPVKIRVSWQKFIDRAYWNVELEHS